MHTYDFDEIIDRNHTDAYKVDSLESRFGATDVIPMWVADMDFRSPQPVMDALMRRVEHGIFGYTVRSESYTQAICGWMKERHGWAVEPGWIDHTSGVVPALRLLVETFTEPGDSVIIQPPVYHPFPKVIEMQQRTVVHNPLSFDGTRYTIDFDDLEEKASAGAKMLILCSPHNPVGRVWTRDELQRLGEICFKHHVLVIADEIHGDLIYSGHKHVPFGSLGPEFAENSITCIAPSKTFNLAGLHTSSVVIPNEVLRVKFHAAIEGTMSSHVNPLNVVALEAAYRHGGPWLDALIAYLQGNLDLLTITIRNKIPQIHVIQPEGTYLVWLDCRGLGLDTQALDSFFVHKAKVALNEGHIFGVGGEGFMRINIACPRSILQKALDQLVDAAAAM